MIRASDESLGAGLLRLKREFKGLGSFAYDDRAPLRREQARLLELNLLSCLWTTAEAHDEPSPLHLPLSVVIEWIGILIAANHTWGYLDHNRPHLGKGDPEPKEVLAKLRGPLRLLAQTERWDLAGDELILHDWDVVVAHWQAVEGARRSESTRRRIPPTVRAKVLELDGEWCKWCGRQDNLTLDHLLPVTEGGRSEVSNLRVLCRSCNAMRNNRRPFSWMMYQLMWYFGVDRDRLAEVLSLLSAPPSVLWNRYDEIGLSRDVHGSEIEGLHDIVKKWMCSGARGELTTHRRRKAQWSEIDYDGPAGTHLRIVSEGCPDLASPSIDPLPSPSEIASDPYYRYSVIYAWRNPPAKQTLSIVPDELPPGIVVSANPEVRWYVREITGRGSWGWLEVSDALVRARSRGTI